MALDALKRNCSNAAPSLKLITAEFEFELARQPLPFRTLLRTIKTKQQKGNFWCHEKVAEAKICSAKNRRISMAEFSFATFPIRALHSEHKHGCSPDGAARIFFLPPYPAA